MPRLHRLVLRLRRYAAVHTGSRLYLARVRRTKTDATAQPHATRGTR